MIERANDLIKYPKKYDGYYSIVTSELDMSDLKMRDVYRGLAKNEDSFRVTKTYFDARPVYVWLNEHTDAHFATCFLSLVLIRLLENRLNHAFSTGQILDALRNYTCTHLDTNTWKFTYYDEVIDACAKAWELPLNDKYKTQQKIQRLLRY